MWAAPCLSVRLENRGHYSSDFCLLAAPWLDPWPQRAGFVFQFFLWVFWVVDSSSESGTHEAERKPRDSSPCSSDSSVPPPGFSPLLTFSFCLLSTYCLSFQIVFCEKPREKDVYCISPEAGCTPACPHPVKPRCVGTVPLRPRICGGAWSPLQSCSHRPQMGGVWVPRNRQWRTVI